MGTGCCTEVEKDRTEMGRIVFLMGKSASGKDTIYKKLLEDTDLRLKPYVGYTTRPRREGEIEGREYHFSDEEQMKTFEAAGKLIEKRVYHTVYGDWYYFSVDTPEVDLDKNDYLYIGTLESFVPVRDYYGSSRVIPVYIEVEDGLRLMRAIERERRQDKPGYEEMCRRFLADCEDFSEEKLSAAKIERRFDNTSLNECLKEIRDTLL